MKFRLLILGGFLLGAPNLWAGGTFPGVKVLPWNGHKAASSLTFDGSDPSQLDVAIPELNQRHLTATFFLIANRTNRKDEWRKILPFGHEIGNFTLDNPQLANLSPREQEAQVEGAQNVLQKEFGISLYTFAYPYSEVTPGLEALAVKTHLFARGGAGTTGVLMSSTEPDWMDIPSRAMEPTFSFSTYRKWIEDCFRKGGWLVWRIQGLEEVPLENKAVSKKVFDKVLDDLQSKDIWVGTFLEVGAYFRAEKIFEKAAVHESGLEKKWTWEVPDHFPDPVLLKVRLSTEAATTSPGVEMLQDGKRLRSDSLGVYLVNFSLGELSLRLSPKS